MSSAKPAALTVADPSAQDGRERAATGQETSTAAPTAVKRDRLVLLDGLRLVAALSVLSYHFTVRDNPAWGAHPWQVFPGISALTQYADLGVNLFFIISGFVVLMTAWGRSTASFAASRVARLFPAYWFSVAATTVLALVLWPRDGLSLWESVANLTMVHSAADIASVDGVYWTLWVELRFYLLIGVLTVLGVTTSRIVALIVLWPAAAALAHTSGSALLSSVLVWNYAPYFCAGMALFLVYRNGSNLLNWLLVLYSWAFMVGITGRYFPKGIVEKTHHDPSLVVTVVIVTLCLGVVWLATTGPARRVSSPWLTVAGALTYPLYLIHEAWGWYFIKLLYPTLPKYVVLVLATLICCAAAWLIHRLVERPIAPILRRSVLSGLTVTKD